MTADEGKLTGEIWVRGAWDSTVVCFGSRQQHTYVIPEQNLERALLKADRRENALEVSKYRMQNFEPTVPMQISSHVSSSSPPLFLNVCM